MVPHNVLFKLTTVRCAEIIANDSSKPKIQLQLEQGPCEHDLELITQFAPRH